MNFVIINDCPRCKVPLINAGYKSDRWDCPIKRHFTVYNYPRDQNFEIWMKVNDHFISVHKEFYESEKWMINFWANCQCINCWQKLFNELCLNCH